jgi:hypothetical protein
VIHIRLWHKNVGETWLSIEPPIQVTAARRLSPTLFMQRQCKWAVRCDFACIDSNRITRRHYVGRPLAIRSTSLRFFASQ